MPIEGRTLHEAVGKFRDHLNRVLAHTVTRTPLVAVSLRGVHLAFRQAGKPIEARLSTRFGPMGLYLGQICESTASKGRHRLRTVGYRYTLRLASASEPLLRWEYVKEPPPPGLWCRHHLQGDVPLRFGRVNRSLNDFHLPTGFVTIEEILRFCIVDLGVRPLSKNWHKILQDSYECLKANSHPEALERIKIAWVDEEAGR